MADFSTRPSAATPWVTNAMTVAALVATLVWSTGQRPQASAPMLVVQNTPAAHANSKNHALTPPASVGELAAASLNAATRPLDGAAAPALRATLVRDAAQPVAYLPNVSR